MAPVVALTGATSGVGRAVARRFARDGAQLGYNQSAHTRSPQLFLAKHRHALAAAATAPAAGAAALAAKA